MHLLVNRPAHWSESANAYQLFFAAAAAIAAADAL